MAPPPLIRLAIDYAAEKGRNNKGCLIFFAAGNGNESVDNDGYASYKNVIAVAACNDQSKRCSYSDYGQAILCAFPSGDIGCPGPGVRHPAPLTTGIWTTDVSPSWGYNKGEINSGDQFGQYTNNFSGTSSACPGAAGIAALILSVNKALTQNEVKYILMACCDKIDEKPKLYNDNGHSPLYGYGRLNAEKAVLLAKNFKTSQ